MNKSLFAVAFLVLGFTSAENAGAQDRMPPIAPDKMTEAQKKAVADYKSIRGTEFMRGPDLFSMMVMAKSISSLRSMLSSST